MARPQQFESAQVLANAMRLFWRKGYEATSMADLLEVTGLSKSSLYASFGGKRELFLLAFDSYREARGIDMQRVMAEGSGRAAIESFFRMIVLETADEFSNGCMSINQAVEMAPHDDEVRQRVLADFRLIEAALVHAIERGRRDGSVLSPRKPRDLAQLLVLAFPGLQVMVRAGFDKEQLEAALAALLSTLDQPASKAR